MVELLEKRKYDDVLKKLESMEHISEVLEFIEQEVKTAYHAGMLRFNAADNTVAVDNNRSKIVTATYDFETGEPALLTNLYLKEKGFTC